MELVEISWQLEALVYASQQNLEGPKVSKSAITSDSSPQAKLPLTATAGFVSSTKVEIGKFPVLRSNKAKDYFFRSLLSTSDFPQKSWIFVQYAVFSIFKALIPHKY